MAPLDLEEILPVFWVRVHLLGGAPGHPDLTGGGGTWPKVPRHSVDILALKAPQGLKNPL